MLVDDYGRPFDTLRISLTDRCNFRCFYCHNEGQGAAVRPEDAASDDELTPEEVERIAAAAASFDVDRVKLTGGEPLVRDDAEEIVARLAGLGMRVSMTTNGSRLAERAGALQAAGLRRVNVSIDSLHAPSFARIRGGPLGPVLGGIATALDQGLTPLKLNLVVVPQTREAIEPLIAFAADRRGLEVQLIQFMPEMARSTTDAPDVDSLRAWLSGRADRTEVRRDHNRRRYHVGGAWVELVDPVGNADFCAACHRLRVTADGRLKGCINVNKDAIPLRGLDTAQLRDAFQAAVARRRPFYGQVVPARA